MGFISIEIELHTLFKVWKSYYVQNDFQKFQGQTKTTLKDVSSVWLIFNANYTVMDQC